MSSPRRAFDYRDAVMLILSALLLVAVIGEWRVASRQPPPVKVFQVLVAARELPTGTAFTKESVDQLTTFKYVPASEIPAEAKLILSRDEIIGKRLARATHEGEILDAADLSKKTQILFDPGQDIMSLQIRSAKVESERVFPGARVDILAWYVEGTERHEFTLLPDMLVLAISNFEDGLGNSTEVSFAVDERQALLVTLASKTNCTFDLVLRRPGSPKLEYDYCKTLARLQVLKKRQDAPPESAPHPRVKS